MPKDAEALNQAILSIAASLDLEEVLHNCLEALHKVISYDMARVFLLSADEARLNMAGRQQGSRWEDSAEISIPAGGDLLFQVRQTLAPLEIQDPAADRRLKAWPLMEGSSHWIGLPLVVRDTLIGLLVVEKSNPDPYPKERIASAQIFAGQAAIAVQNAQLFEQVREGRERQKQLSRQLVEVQEAERRSIARELHDQIGQVLTGLKLVLEMSSREASGEQNENIAEALTLVDELMAQVRELSLSMRPAMLDDLGLLPALLWQFDRYTVQTHVEVDFQHRQVEGVRFDPEVETGAFRIIQEALTNVARHAGVGRVRVRLWADDQGLYLQVEDQGRGFDPDVVLRDSTTRGLSGMSERANLLGGNLSIDSTPGEGALLSAKLPIGSYFERRRKNR